jgi:prophage regulatory protein
MSQKNPALPEARRILRLKEVETKVGFKRSYLYKLMSKGEFPRTIPLGLRAVGWDSTEVDDWIGERIKNRVPFMPASKV